MMGSARDGDVAAVAALLGDDPSAVNTRGRMGATPLHAAAAQGALGVVELLLAKGADPRARRDDGDTPLHRAAGAAVAELLIRFARDGRPDQRNDLQQTPLHTCTDDEVAEVLLRHGASLTARDFAGATPLGDAGAAKARVLLNAGAEVDARDHGGRTALHRAVARDDAEVVELLLAAGADPALRDVGGESPVHLAANRRREGIGERLRAALATTTRSLAERADASTVGGLGQREPRMGSDGRTVYSVAGHAVLVRWRLDESPRPEAIAATEHRMLSALAVDPRGGVVAVAPADAPVELRRSDDLAVVSVLDDLAGITALAFSPDGRWLAAATGNERVLLVDSATGKVTAELDAGERNDSVAFSPDGRLLATACSFQGGAHVRLDRVHDDGQLYQHALIDRADRGTAPEHFVDTIPGLAFTPGGRLAIWETSAIYHERRPPGWRGNLLLADTDGRVLWHRSIDATVTGRRTSLEVCGSPMGYFTTPGPAAAGETIALALDGVVVQLAAADGTPAAVVPIAGKAGAVCADRLVATDSGWQQLPC